MIMQAEITKNAGAPIINDITRNCPAVPDAYRDGMRNANEQMMSKKWRIKSANGMELSGLGQKNMSLGTEPNPSRYSSAVEQNVPPAPGKTCHFQARKAPLCWSAKP
jgi:hypothetical protein